MSIAYLLGKGSGKLLHVNPNIPLLLVLSILPDIDILYDFFVNPAIPVHRGATHSIVIAAIAFIPIFIFYGKKAVPYFLALISHPLIGDFIVGGRVELFWPITNNQYGLHELGYYYIDIFSWVNVALESSLFVIAMLVLYKSGDWKVFLSKDKTNLLLIIPVATVLLPSTIGYPFSQSLIIQQPILAIAHIIYLILFAIAILTTLKSLFKSRFRRKHLVTDQATAI